MGMPMKCDQCVALTINGVYCHEHGCPNIRKEREAEEDTDEEDPWACGCDCGCTDPKMYEDDGICEDCFEKNCDGTLRSDAE